MFKFPASLFTPYGLTYVDKSPDELEDNECCWHKETRTPGGDYLHYRMTMRRFGVNSDLVVQRYEFLQWVGEGKGDEYMREVMRRVTSAS